MNLFVLSGLLIAISSIFFGFFVFLREPKNRFHQLWLFFSLAVAMWGIGVYEIGSTVDKETALLWWRLTHIGVILIPVFFAQFIYAWLEIRKKFFSYFTYLFATFFSLVNLYDLLISPTGLFIIDTRWVFNSFYYDSPPGSLYLIFTLLWIFIILHANYELFKVYKKSTGIKRVQIKYFIFAVIISYAGGITSFLPVFGIDFYPYFNFATPFYVAMMSYIILRYHLFNIKVIATELLTLAILLIMLIQVFLSKTSIEFLVNIILFAVTTIVGVFIVRSVRKEVKTREEMEKLALSLERANEKLKVIDEAKSDFVHIASHQLRTPLTAIRGYSSLILEDTYGKVTPKIKDPIEKILKSSERMVKMIGDFLNVSRIEKGKIDYNFEKFNIKKMVKNLVDEFKVNVIKNIDKKIEFKITDKTEGDIYINGDVGKINQIISNLIDNAIKYTNGGCVGICISSSDGKVLISIKDSGIGMSKETQNKIFEKFARADNASKYHTNGSGLGLYIAKEFVKAHKGRIWAESKGEGEGSTFSIELPRI